MEAREPEPVTELLLRWSAGDPECLNRLLPQVEDELRRIAHRYMRMERQGHTLQTTALVNEAYLKLVTQAQVNWQDRAHFLGVAARVTNLDGIRVAGWGWFATAPNNSLITARDAGTDEIYALDWEAP